jgi:hypothetical protein
MPSRSPAQARLMAAVAHGWHPPASSAVSVPVGVAREFNKADQQVRTNATVKALRRNGNGK